MMPNPVVVCVMGKYPAAGRVKTRLCPPLRGDAAAAIAGAFLREIARRLHAADVSHAWCFSPADAARAFGTLVAHSASEVARFPQVDGDLGVRLADAVVTLRRTVAPDVAVLLRGTDSPDLPDHLLADARRVSAATDVTLGPTDDGGYWCLGVGPGVDPARLLLGETDAVGEPLDPIDWSSGREFVQTRRRAERLDYRVGVVGRWPDVDRFDDVTRLIARLPDGEFRDGLRRILGNLDHVDT